MFEPLATSPKRPMMIVPIPQEPPLRPLLVLILTPGQYSGLAAARSIGIPLDGVLSSFPAELFVGNDWSNPNILLCFEEDIEPIQAYLVDSDLNGLLLWLRRGYGPNHPEPSQN